MYIAVTDNNIGIGPRIQSSSSVYFVELPIGSGEESPPKSQMSKVIAINLDP
jgi:hypothetical protein